MDPVEQRARTRIGTVLKGKYRLDRLLGVGGMAAVYVGTHRNLKQFAIKMLHPELSLREDVRARFLREGYAANAVKHPGAVAAIDDDTADDGAAFLVMELLEGSSVEELWEKRGRTLPVDVVLGIAEQLLDVLAAAHTKGVVHRDIKPENLFLTHDGQVKVLDFGIARVRDLAAGRGNATATGILLGTPAFMAPEQALGKTSAIDELTDLWAVGATMFTLLSGRTVHEGETGAEIAVRSATTPAQPLASVVQVPADVAHAVDRALAFEKKNRWPNASQMRDEVRALGPKLFGRPLSRETLAGLQPKTASMPPPEPALPARDGTSEMRTIPVPRASASGPHGTVRTSSPEIASSPRPIVGAATEQPVTQVMPSPARTAVHRRFRVALIAGVGAALILGTGTGVLLATRAQGPALETAPSSRALAAASFAASAASVAPPAPPAPSVPVLSVDALPTARAPAAAVAPPKNAAAVAPPPAQPLPRNPYGPPSSPAPPPAAPASRPAADCQPPYFFDAQGRKRFKPECL